MSKYLMIGGGGHARMIIDTLMTQKSFIGYVDIKANREMEPIPYLGDDSAALRLLESDRDLIPVFGIGLIKNAPYRAKIIEKYYSFHNRFRPVISSTAVVAKSTSVGVGTIIGVNAAINNGAVLGNFCIVNTGAIIEHEVKIGHNIHLAPGSVVCGAVEIEQNTLVGARAVIGNGVHVKCDVIIGLGAVVISDITESGTYIGIPARRI